MAEYDPPIYDVSVFNPAYFLDEDEITKAYLRANFLEFPIGQGLETLPDLRINKDNIHLGTDAGLTNQSTNATVAVGFQAGKTDQSEFAVAMGRQSGEITQGEASVAVGNFAGNDTQGNYSVAVGRSAGRITQGDYSVAVGWEAGISNQSQFAVAMGRQSGGITQGEASVSIGNFAGNDTQGIQSVAIGRNAGRITQGDNSVAIGFDAGATNAGEYSVSIGRRAGLLNIGENSIAIGNSATSSGTESIAIGAGATTSTFTTAVAIGNSAIATANNQFSLGIGSSVYRFAGLINNLTRRVANGTQTNVLENGDRTILFQTIRTAGLLDYNTTTGIFTNNTGRTLIAMISVSLELEISGAVSGRRQLFLYKNSTRQAVSSAEIGTVGQDGSSLSMTFDIDNGDTIKATVFYTDTGTVNIGVVRGETQISILCL